MTVEKAARWLATTPDEKKPHPLVPYLRSEFGLTPKEAVDAMREAALIKARSA